MKITATPYDDNGVAGAPITLGDDDAGDYIAEYTGELPSTLEQVRFFGAQFPEIIDHGYKANSRSWKVDREHASAADAFTFAETHPLALAGNCTLQIEDDTGSIYFNAWCQSAKCILRVGKNSIFQYQFLCQSATTTPPTN